MKKQFLLVICIISMLSISGCNTGSRSSELERKILDKERYLIQDVTLIEQDATHYSGSVTYLNGQAGTIIVKLEWEGSILYRQQLIKYVIQPN